MESPRLVYRIHAMRRMAQRGITAPDVRKVFETGEVIEEYPDDIPYPSRLVLGFPAGRPLHVVAADNPDDQETIVITAYEPDPSQWGDAFRTRRT